MEKVKLEYSAPEKKIIKFNNSYIEVEPFISLQNQIILIKRYMEVYFGNKDSNPMLLELNYSEVESEYDLQIGLLSLITNIDIEEMNYEILDAYNLYDMVIKNVSNYDLFMKRLNETKQEMLRQKQIEFSAGNVFKPYIEIIAKQLSSLPEINISDILEKTALLKKENKKEEALEKKDD